MASVDYRVYCQAEAEERDRASRIYTGEERDPGVAAEHFLPSQLPELFQKPLPSNMNATYLQEYGDMMASMRATAMLGLQRKHFYEYAALCAKEDRKLLELSLREHTRIIDSASTHLSPDLLVDLQNMNDLYEASTSEIRQKVEAEQGNSAAFSFKTIVKMFMSLKNGVNPFGSAVEVPRDLTPYDKTKYEGIRARLACPCCGNLIAPDDFVSRLESLEDSYGHLRLSSAYRCPKKNAAVGGAKSSFHLRGEAVDILISSVEERERLAAAAKSLGFTGFGRSSMFLHIDTGPARTWEYPVTKSVGVS